MLDALESFRRRSLLIGGLIMVAAMIWAASTGYFGSPPGEYETRQGNILLSDGKYAQAVERFDAALTANPHYRGAMMGRAIALLQQGKAEPAEKAFNDLIAVLQDTVDPNNAADQEILAAAYADRGILYDRNRQPEKALADYRRALAADAEAVSGPGVIDRVLYGIPNPATVAKRIAYLEAQLKLPPEQRVLTRPKLDARQRMYQP